jgi:hypothetical protein
MQDWERFPNPKNGLESGYTARNCEPVGISVFLP